jgi:hypothetical protein
MIERTKEERKEAINLQEALQLKPDEGAIVIIKDNKNNRSLETFNISTGNVLETLARTLAKITYLCSIQRNISEEERLSYLELLLSFIKDEYEVHYSKGTKLEL